MADAGVSVAPLEEREKHAQGMPKARAAIPGEREMTRIIAQLQFVWELWARLQGAN